MLLLAGGQVESLWDEVLPGEVKELPEDFAALDVLLSEPVLLEPIVSALAARSARSWSPDDLDGHVRAVDGDQAAHRLGVRDVDARGIGFDSSAAVLSDRAGGAGPGRVNGAQVHSPARGRGRERDHQGGDRGGQAGEAVSSAGGEDRLDCGGGRRALSHRFGVGVGQRSRRWLARRASCSRRWRRDAGHVRDRSRCDRPSSCVRCRVRCGAGPGRRKQQVLEFTAQAGKLVERSITRGEAVGGGRAAHAHAAVAPRPSCDRSTRLEDLHRALRAGRRADPEEDRAASGSPTVSCRCSTRTPGRSARASSASPTYADSATIPRRGS